MTTTTEDREVKEAKDVVTDAMISIEMTTTEISGAGIGMMTITGDSGIVVTDVNEFEFS